MRSVERAAVLDNSSEDKTASRAKGNIMLVDDHAIVRAGLRGLLMSSGYEVVSEAEDLGVILDVEGLNERVDVIILDLNLQSTSGLHTLEQARAMFPDTSIIVYSAIDELEQIASAYHMGVNGYIPKAGCGETEVLDALEQVIKGQTYTVPEISGDLVKYLAQARSGQNLKDRLTPPEYRIFLQLREGRTYEEIAENLGLGVDTVRSRGSRIRRKLGLAGTDFWRRVPIDWVKLS